MAGSGANPESIITTIQERDERLRTALLRLWLWIPGSPPTKSAVADLDI
jgi:hypothetical protein